MTHFFFASGIFIAASFFEATVIPWTFGVFFPFSHWVAIMAFSLLSFPAASFFLIFSGAFFLAVFPVFGAVRFMALAGAALGILLTRRVLDEELAARMIAFAVGVFFAWMFEFFAARLFIQHAAMMFSRREALVNGFLVIAVSLGFLLWSFWQASKKVGK